MTTLGSRISRKRKVLNLTQEELAAKLGVSSQAVSKWENDISCPDITLLPALAKALNTTVDELLTGKSNEVRLVPEASRKNPDDLVLRIRVTSTDGDKIRVNLPIPLLRVLAGSGMDIATEVSGIESLKSLDMQKILELVENGTIGKIVEIESADGDTVEIVVE